MIKNTLKEVTMPSHLGQDGSGLSVLVSSEYQYMYNWMTYSAWYSLNKNLPEAKVAIVCPRSKSVDSMLYGWVYKCDVRYMLHKNVGELYDLSGLNKIYGVYLALKHGLVRQPLVVMDADVMAVDDFTSDTMKVMQDCGFAKNLSGSLWYFNNQPLEKIEEVINTLKVVGGNLDLALDRVFSESVVLDDLANESYEQGVTTFTRYRERCGNFTGKEWEKGRTLPPFSVGYALQATDMTVNERKVISLWSQMNSLFDSMSQVK
jgi:hypothetical protein